MFSLHVSRFQTVSPAPLSTFEEEEESFDMRIIRVGGGLRLSIGENKRAPQFFSIADSDSRTFYFWFRILDRIEEGWQGEVWAINMPQIVNEILHQNLLTTRTPPATRTSHDTDGIQWILMEELGKTLTNRCRAVPELKRTNARRRGELETDTPIANNLNSNANSKHPHGAVSTNSLTLGCRPHTTSSNP